MSVNRFIFIGTPHNREIVDFCKITYKNPLNAFTFNGFIVTMFVAEVKAPLQELYKNSWRYSCMTIRYTIFDTISTIFGVF